MPSRGFQLAFRSIYIGYLLLFIVMPILTVYGKGLSSGWQPFWQAISGPTAWHALRLTLSLSFLAALIQMAIGTLIAYVLVRYRFPGRRLLNSMVDLPFALPTAVVGLMLLTLLGPHSPVGAALASIGVHLLYNKASIVLGMILITFPFVIRTVQPLLEQLERDEEEASFTLGASKGLTFRRIIIPALLPGIAAGGMLAFTRALAEFGAISLISGNLPGKTMVISVYIFGDTQNYQVEDAAALSILLLTFSLASLWGVHALQARKGQFG